jgi:hypothetical protein
VSVFDASADGNNLGTSDAAFDGSFPEVLVGTTTSSYKQLWAQASDKCNSPVVRVEVTNGTDTTAPTVDGARFTFFSMPAGTPDDLSAIAGALTDMAPSVVAAVRVFAASTDTTPVATLSFAADGSVARQAAGEIHHAPFLAAIDKAGNVSAKVVAGPDYDWPRWPMPASPTVFCSDGTSAVACPSAGGTAYGQDANYRLHVPTYTTTADTVTDSVTGLTWQRDFSASTLSWAEAQSYCDDLVLAGNFDWRLPTVLELISIVDNGRMNPSIDTAAFPATPMWSFWSSSPYAPIKEDAWLVDFADGHPSHYGRWYGSKVRCVR